MDDQPALFVEPLTPEEDIEARRQQLELDYALVRVARSVGGHVSSRGGRPYVIPNPEALGLEAPADDDEHPDLKLPRILRNSVYLPLGDRTLTPRAFTAPFRKTPAKERAFMAGCTREGMLSRYIAVEAGAEYERRAIEPVNSAALALDALGATPADQVRAVRIDCRDEKLAAEIVESQRDSLPWVEVEIRSDGSLEAGWHGGRLSPSEQELLKLQHRADRAQKRHRLEKLARQMLRESA